MLLEKIKAVTLQMRDRAVPRLQYLAGLDRNSAAELLEGSGKSVKLALLMHWTNYVTRSRHKAFSRTQRQSEGSC